MSPGTGTGKSREAMETREELEGKVMGDAKRHSKERHSKERSWGLVDRRSEVKGK